MDEGQTRGWNGFLDDVLDGKKPDAGTFARSAIGEVPRAAILPRYPTGGAAVWGEAMWAEMVRISKGEVD